MKSDPQNSHPLQFRFPNAFIILLLLITTYVLYVLSIRLISQICYQRADNHINNGCYDLAEIELRTADHYCPDDFKIIKKLGKVFSQMGNITSESEEKKLGVEEAFLFTHKAKDFYLKSFALNNLDAGTAYGLARIETRLEQLYLYLHPEKGAKEHPYQPLKYYKQAVRLYPGGIHNNYAMVRYLFRHRNKKELFSAVRTLGRIYPSSLDHLKEEKLWSPLIRNAFKKGLLEAIDENISSKEAQKALSSMAAEENAWLSAISYYEKALEIRTFENNAEDYVALGFLCLKNVQIEKAEVNFVAALEMTGSPEKLLEKIYHMYQKEGLPERFLLFLQNVSGIFAYSFSAELFKVRILVDLNRYQRAREVLTDLNQKEPTAAAYFWLYRIAEIEKDLDKMELAIQKATVLDRENIQYHLIFSKVLKKLKKLGEAEKEIDLAIKYAAKSKAWYYDLRARIRWDRKNYQGAAKDWLKAIALRPEKASYYGYAAESLIKLGDWNEAALLYKNACNLDPENSYYKEKYSRLKKR